MEYSDEWELSKENVRPRKQGRNVSSLTAALQPQDDKMLQIKQEKQLFESELRMYSGSDPLDTWDRYIRWTEEVYPKGGKDGKLRILLERCITIFKDEEKYKNDQRYVQAWIKFASFCSDPVEMFAYMFDNKIGSSLASLYDAWASALEDVGNNKNADAIFQEGLRRQAEPVDLLVRRHQEFQARVARGLMGEDMDTNEREVVGGQIGGQVEEQRTALGQLRGRGKHQVIGTTRTGHAKLGTQRGIKSESKPNQTPGMGFQIFNDENSDPSNRPQQTGEWETVPRTGTTNRENEQKPGPWNKARVSQKTVPVSKPTPAFTVHVDDESDQPMVTPQKPAHVDSQVLSVRKPEKPSNPLAHIQQSAPSGGLEQRPMYNKAKIYRGLEEFSFEELRGMRWQVKHQQKLDMLRQKQEQEQRLAEERQKIQEEADRLRQAKQELVDFQRSLQEQMVQERNKMMLDLRNQMALQQEHLENQRRSQTEKAQSAIDQDIQQRLQNQLNISNTPDTEEHTSERLTRQLKFDDLTSHGNTENIPPRLTAQLAESDKSRKIPQADTSLNSSQRTPVFNTSVGFNRTGSSGARPKSRGPTPESGNFRNGHVSMTAPSPTVNTQEAFQVVRGMFNASLDCERQFGWQPEEVTSDITKDTTNMTVPQQQMVAPAGQPFAIYDESGQTSSATPMVVSQDPAMDKENTPPKDYKPSPQRRRQLSGYLQPATDIPVDPMGEQDVVMVETEKVKCDDGSPLDCIEHMPPSDLTLAPLGSSESFAAAACLASTPYFGTGKFCELPNPSLSHIKPDNQTEEAEAESMQREPQNSFDVSLAQKITLSPIMEGSTEHSGEESKCHASQLTTSKHHTTINELSAANMAPIPEDAKTHKICLADYVPPEQDEKTEALLSMSIMINPHDPFDPQEIEDLLSNLDKPLDKYDNYNSIDTPVPDLSNGSFITLDAGAVMYTVESCIGKGAFGSVYKATKFDLENLDDMCDMDIDEKFLAIKVQKPACPWEFYICSEISKRLKTLNDPMDVRDSIMSISQGIFFKDGSALISDYLSNGSLLSLVNFIRPTKSLRGEMEPLVMFLTIELLHMVEKLHQCHIIHGDIKPDNFLVRGIPYLGDSNRKEEVFGRSTQCLKLIDFGRSIDMTKYPPGTTFLAKSETSGFQCIEMMTDMPWNYQTDLFGLIGTIHVLIFCEYMKVYQSQGVWHMTGSFQRKWNVSLWKSVFHRLLNIPSCEELPDLSAIRHELEEYFMANLVSKYNQIALKIVTHLNENNTI